MSELYIGLMSGTSADGIDAALVDFTETFPKMIANHYTPFTTTLRDKILELMAKGDNEIQRLGELDIILGKEFAQAAKNLLAMPSVPHHTIKAIGSHGQTIRHYPHLPHRFTMQIGDPNTIAAETGITTIADFRRKDIAHGGQGAPLVPAFHQHIFASHEINRAIVNIGGIANITILPRNAPRPILGFDTGPGNVLLDAWIHKHHNKPHDQHGEWGARGNVDTHLLAHMLTDHYFQLPPPKSTGREYFNLSWLEKYLRANKTELPPEDVQATLTELTARTIIMAIRQHIIDGEILICGGGAHNKFLMSRLQDLAKAQFSMDSTDKYGIPPDWVEAMAFAWLARQTLNHKPGNLPSVTGAKQAVILGGIYYGY